MDILLIKTEEPKVDQWKLLLQFSYSSNIKKFLQDKGFDYDESLINFIAGCIQQSEQYFSASEQSSLDISPLLLYYGLTNLFAGASSLLTGKRPGIKDHGLVYQNSNTRLSRIGDLVIKPINHGSGALQQFSNVFSDSCPLANSGNWSLIEILASIPDLRNDFVNCYKGYPTFTIPTEVVRKPRYSFERIDPSEVSDRADFVVDLKRLVANFEKAYFDPQFTNQMNRVVLYRRLNSLDIGIYSIFGQKYLQIGHDKHNVLLNPSQLLLMFMGMFTLGFVSRYIPDTWNPFVRNDTTGEKLVIEKFLEICRRYSPNIVLNFLNNRRIQFVNSLDKGVEIKGEIPPLTEEEIKKIRDFLDNRGSQ